MDDDLTQALAWAERLGAHALPVLAAALFAVLIACTTLVIGLHRYGAHTAWQRLPRPLLLGACLVLGAGVLIGMASLFAEMLEAFDAEEEIGRFDERLTETLARELSPMALRFFGLWTHLGDPWLLTLLVSGVGVLLLVRRHFALALGWVVACAGAGLLNRLLKQIFERVRPVHEHGGAHGHPLLVPGPGPGRERDGMSGELRRAERSGSDPLPDASTRSGPPAGYSDPLARYRNAPSSVRGRSLEELRKSERKFRSSPITSF